MALATMACGLSQCAVHPNLDPTIAPTLRPTFTPATGALSPIQEEAPATAARPRVSLPIVFVGVAAVAQAPTMVTASANAPSEAAPLPTSTPGAASLPTSTPTPTPVPTGATPLHTLTPGAAPQATASPPPTPILTQTEGWVFSRLRASADGVGNLVVLGEVTNETGSAQEIVSLAGTFHDAQGGVMADPDRMDGYWPADLVPPGGQLPFELTVFGIQDAHDFDLAVQSQPTNIDLHQGFAFSNVEPWSEEGVYCLVGLLQHAGYPVKEYVVVMAVFYDAQDGVIGFGEYYVPALELGENDGLLDFDLCAELDTQAVARHELRAWGQ